MKKCQPFHYKRITAGNYMPPYFATETFWVTSYGLKTDSFIIFSTAFAIKSKKTMALHVLTVSFSFKSVAHVTFLNLCSHSHAVEQFLFIFEAHNFFFLNFYAFQLLCFSTFMHVSPLPHTHKSSTREKGEKKSEKHVFLSFCLIV